MKKIFFKEDYSILKKENIIVINIPLNHNFKYYEKITTKADNIIIIGHDGKNKIAGIIANQDQNVIFSIKQAEKVILNIFNYSGDKLLFSKDF